MSGRMREAVKRAMAHNDGTDDVKAYGTTYKNIFNGVDIDSEYKLIQEKKSKLPRSMRDLIVMRHEALEKKKTAPVESPAVKDVDTESK